MSLIHDLHIHDENLVQYVSDIRNKFVLSRRILLIQTPQFSPDVFSPGIAKRRGYYAFPPVGLLCLARSLLERKFEVTLFDLNYEILKSSCTNPSFQFDDWKKLLDETISRVQPSIIGITSLTSFSDMTSNNHPLHMILKHLGGRGMLVVIGGPSATNGYESFLQKNLCQFAVIGEGEEKMNYLIDTLYNEHTSQPRDGVFFSYHNTIMESKGYPGFIPLEKNLIGTYHLIPLSSYCEVGSLNPYSRMAGMNTIFATFQLNRGCRANCRFCDVTKFMGRSIRHYPTDLVIAEMRYLITTHHVRHFEALDDDFLGDSPATENLLRGMVSLRKEFGITWSANNGLIAASITDELMELMRDSGCLGFRIGVESGNPEMLIRIRKPGTLSLFRKKAEILNRYPELFVGANYILGLFGEETVSQMMDTFRFAQGLNLDWSSYTTFQVTSKATSTVEGFNSSGGTATDFIPAKDRQDGLLDIEDGIVTGPAIFSLSPDMIPSSDQVKHIWFVFNLLTNYVFNKNLLPGGRPDKLASWLRAIQVTYPNNPYMHLFLGLCCQLQNHQKEAFECFKKANQLVETSPYWTQRFTEFHLLNLAHSYPDSPEQARKALDVLRLQCADYLH